MKYIFLKWFMTTNSLLIKISNGRIGSKLGTQTILILNTVGRKSGQPHLIPIAYFFHEGNYFIVASNWGKEKNADWYLNLLKNPRATLLLNGETIQAEAHDAEGDEYTQLWKFATERHPPYLRYQEITTRHIPIVVFQAK